MTEWKINNWWMKTLFVASLINGAITIINFIIGFIIGFTGGI